MGTGLVEHGGGHVDADEVDLGVQGGDLHQLGGGPTAQVNHPAAALQHLRGAGRVKQVGGSQGAIIAAGFREGGHLVGILHDGIGLRFTRQCPGTEQLP